jgi:drug/metabolite transporter (DMT)-like permease
MLFIVLRALCNTAFAQLLRLSQARRPETMGVITVNYLVATLVSLLLTRVNDPVQYLPATVWYGLLGGVGYIVSIILLMPAMAQCGVSVSVAVLQLAVLVPVAFAMIAYGEAPSPAQWFGIALATVSLVFLSLARTLPVESRVPKFSPMLLVLFLVTGVSGIAMKAFSETAPTSELPGFMAILFGTATAGGVLMAIRRRVAWDRGDLILGAAIGLANAGQLEFLLRAMETVPAVVVFPASSALALVLNSLASIRWWGERISAGTALGLAMALAATLLLNG